MRLIDADKLRKDVLDLPNCYNGFSDTYDKAMIVDLVDEQPTVDAEPVITYEQVIEYCRRRSLVIVTAELFNDMRAIWSLLRKADDFEEPEINPCRGCTDYDGQGGCKSNGGCGAERREDETN